jgi:hypothetical protein
MGKRGGHDGVSDRGGGSSIDGRDGEGDGVGKDCNSGDVVCVGGKLEIGERARLVYPPSKSLRFPKLTVSAFRKVYTLIITL